MPHKFYIIKLSKTHNYTLDEIAKRVGCTRQRVHQILKANGIKNKKIHKPIKYPIVGFVTKMRSWLKEAGYLHCGKCGWTCKDNFGKVQKKIRYCRACHVKKEREYFLKDRKRYYERQARWRLTKKLKAIGLNDVEARELINQVRKDTLL